MSGDPEGGEPPKRLAFWGLWLEETLLAGVPHRQVVLAVPKRLRLSVGIVASIQTHGSLANWHPHR